MHLDELINSVGLSILWPVHKDSLGDGLDFVLNIVHIDGVMRCLLIASMVLTVFRSLTCEESSEFVKFDLTGTVLVHFLDQLLNVKYHFEFVLDCLNQFLRIDAAVAVWLSTHGSEGLKIYLVSFLFTLHYVLEIGRAHV